MLPFFIFAVIWTSGQADHILDRYTYSSAVGGGSGTSFSTEADGHITALRVWERSSSYIAGFQLRYDHVWSSVYGVEVGIPQEIYLFDRETIVQVSGKYSGYIYLMTFVTSRGRFLTAGQPTTYSFNFYSTLPDAELMLLSGRFDGSGITSLGAHWGLDSTDHKESKETEG